jgi:hypothetical protein
VTRVSKEKQRVIHQKTAAKLHQLLTFHVSHRTVRFATFTKNQPRTGGSLKIACTGYAFLAFRGRSAICAATVIGPVYFLLRAAGGHLLQMIRAHNFAPGKAGVIFYTDLLLPVIGFVLLWLEYRCSQNSTFAKMSTRQTSSAT